MKTIVSKSITTILLLLAVTFSVTAQVKKGDEYFANFNYPEAVKSYKQALKMSSKNEDHISIRLAESYRLMADYKNAEIWYAKVVKIKNVQPINYFHYGKMLESNSKFAEAKEWFAQYIEKLPQDSRAVQYKNYTAEIAAELLRDKGNYQISSVNVNSSYDDFSPVYFGRKVVFASNRPGDLLVSRKHSWNNMPFVDLYVSDIQDDDDLIDANKFPQFNKEWHEGPVTFTQDLKRIYFTRNASRGNNLLKGINSTTNLMIYTARKVTLSTGEEQWTEAEALDFNSVEYTCQHPSISPDGQKLYFASDQPGGFGGMDIYVTERTILGWSRPKNLGPSVNTSGDEAFPFITATGDLYFASKGHLGVGGFDVFLCRPVETGFGKATNLGYPINDVMDDFGFVLNESEDKGYFSSNRAGGMGHDDIYHLKVLNKPEVIEVEDTVKKETEPVVVNPVEVKKSPEANEAQLVVFVYDKISGNGLKEAVVNIFTRQGKLVGAVQVGEDGYATLNRADYSGNLRFITSYPEYTSYREIVTIENLPYKNARIDLPLSKDLGKVSSIGGKNISINPIYFDYDKSNIRPDAAVELDKIVRIMKENPTMVIEVASHTDSRGNNQYNIDLSQRRAKSSREYIISRGISEDRIFGQGYGENQLTNQCEDGVDCREPQHQMNRRTEFQIVRF